MSRNQPALSHISNKLRLTLLTLFLLLLTVRLAQSTETVSLTSGEWPPYLSEKLPDYGVASKIVTEAFWNVGIDVQYGFFPWNRSYRYAINGKDEKGQIWHGTLVWIYTKDRSENFFYSDPVITDSKVFFHMKNKPLEWENLEDLRGKIIGGTLHTAYPALETAEKQGVITIERGGHYKHL